MNHSTQQDNIDNNSKAESNEEDERKGLHDYRKTDLDLEIERELQEMMENDDKEVKKENKRFKLFSFLAMLVIAIMAIIRFIHKMI
ncbi:hypothetical protein Q4528_01090 [Staphylococcus pasteuri_A]|uniref:Transmembrane protein n=2 Tax=Staphylococcus TaxID=1279 RepID=A0AAW7YRG6_9STAP|nr:MULTISPECIES: hypothetical protein [Staphylococcus]MCF7599913.1 hypothetical protein [Staphylococcus pasteuri]MDO6572747.1 hypothetical protein [Staphylococcus pasteuri_A]MEB6209517.1 hypothetical protein [Staphylococcus pasteuri]